MCLHRKGQNGKKLNDAKSKRLNRDVHRAAFVLTARAQSIQLIKIEVKSISIERRM